jgi:hypothetical protein
MNQILEKCMRKAGLFPARSIIWLVVGICSFQNIMKAGSLDALIDPIDPDITKWASLVVLEGDDSHPKFSWHHYRDSENAVDFWPASTIKIYAAVAALEYLNELQYPLDCALIYERRTESGWQLDTARTMREMISEVFRRSSNEDYTLLLRFVGIDRINTEFLIPERGFPHSALMRDYVVHRPVVYENTEPQRVRIVKPDGTSRLIEHKWSGVSYAEQRGATVLSSTTGNCTSTQELAECLRRIMFHEILPDSERYRLTPEQLSLLRFGGDGLYGLENKEAGPYAWEGRLKEIYPKARFFHKAGMISNYTLDVACIDDESSHTRFILCVAAETGKGDTVRKMAGALAEWIHSGSSH